ncbi:MAG: VOC family protein [Bacteroidota bacterium]
MQKITPCLWFDHEGKEAATFYCNLFPDSKLISSSPLITEFQLCGNQFMALNGGPKFQFTEAVSFSVSCKDQEEVDHYWFSLIADGGEESMCGWLKDKYGLSWQIVPIQFIELMSTGTENQKKKLMEKLFTMRRIIIQDLQAAYNS